VTNHSRHKGFTLVEVLVAVTIFGIAISTLFGSFNIVISNIDPIKAGLDNYEMGQNTMDRIQKDLMSLCLTRDPIYTQPGFEEFDDPDRFRFVSKKIFLDGNSFSQLRFASFEHLAFDKDQKSRIGIITYYVESSEDGTIVLKRSDIGSVFYNETVEYNTKNDPLLCEKIKTFELMFIDQEGNTYENWDSDSSNFDFSTPYSIKIKLEIGDPKKSDFFATTIVLPILREKNES
jgi:general secretion pathway protein J